MISSGTTIIFSSGQLSANVVLTGNINDGAILNADINSAAAIAISKLSGVAALGANSDITSLSGLTTPLTVAQGGTSAAAHTAYLLLAGNGAGALAEIPIGSTGQVMTSNGAGANPSFQAAPSEWTYLQKLTFASETATKTASSLAVHDEWMLVFYLNADASGALTLKLKLNTAGSATGLKAVNNAIGQDGGDGTYLTLGGWGTSRFWTVRGRVTIAGKHNNGTKSVKYNVSGGEFSNDYVAISGSWYSDSNDLTRIDVISTANVTGTVELWYKDAK